jgi:hypothetical protein
MEKIIRIKNQLEFSGMLYVHTNERQYILKVVPSYYTDDFEIEVKQEQLDDVGYLREFIQINKSSIQDARIEVNKLIENDDIFNEKVVELFN